MKSCQLEKHSLNRREKVPTDCSVPLPFDCSMHKQIGTLSLCLDCIGKESSCNLPDEK